MDLTNVTFIKVDIEETKIVAFFRRSGPLYNVTLPKSEYLFLSNNGYKMTIRQYVLGNGSIVNAEKIKKTEAVSVEETEIAKSTVEETKTEAEEQTKAKPEEPAEKQTDEAPAKKPAPVEEKIKEPAPVVLPEDLCSTIESTENSIQVRTLTMEQYATYTKDELLKFVKALSASLPDEVVKQVENDRNISKSVLLEIINTNVVADE
jgi:outer membrane biosynthesis protein TonB